MKKYSIGRQAAGCVLALLSIWLQPMMLPIMLRVIPQSVGLVLWYVWFGPAAAFVMALTVVGTFFAMGGWALAGVSVLAAVAPAAFSIAMLMRRVPFFVKLRWSIIAQCLALVVSLGIGFLVVGGNLVDALVGSMRGLLGASTSGTLDFLLSFLASSSGQIAQSALDALTDAQKIDFLMQWFESAVDPLKLQLPSLLITSGALTGMLMAAWPALICVKRGDEPPVEYVPLSDWRLPNQLVTGVLLSLLTGYVLEIAAVPGAASLVLVLTDILFFLFAVAACAGIARLLRLRGVSRRIRTGLVVLLILFAVEILWMAGAVFCLFGRKGIVREYIRKWKQKNGEGSGSE